MKERRKFSRINFVADVKVQFKGSAFEAELLDISLRGALLQLKATKPLELGLMEDCGLSFTLTPSAIRLDFNIKLVHLRHNHFGFKFISEDLATITHLRRLLELNLGDDAMITGELPFLVSD